QGRRRRARLDARPGPWRQRAQLGGLWRLVGRSGHADHRPLFPRFAERRVMTERFNFDGVIVVGAGLAGLSAALAAAPRRALLLSAAPLTEGCASAWAQGGMAAALSEDADPALHAADTLAAGAGLCDPAAVQILTRGGPDAVRRLADLGAPFDRRADGG